MKKLIIFVCDGNIYRSVIAAECLSNILKVRRINSKFSANSYGLQGTKGTDLPKHKHLSEYPKEWKAAMPSLQKFHIDISKHSFQKISAAVIKKASVIIAMDNKVYSTAKNSLLNQFPNYIEKIHRFSELTTRNKIIRDPAGISNEKIHKKIIADIHTTVSKKYQDILSWAK